MGKAILEKMANGLTNSVIDRQNILNNDMA